MKDGKTLRIEFEFLKGNCKIKRAGKFRLIKETLYKWYGKCSAAGIYPFGSLLQEEALKIKENLKDNWLDSFADCNGWLEKWEAAYGIRQTRVTGKLMMFQSSLWDLESKEYLS